MLNNFGQQKPGTVPAGTPGGKHEQVLRELDEIKRYVANIWEKVDGEINEILNSIKAVEKEVKDNDRQLDRMEMWDKKIQNMENMIRNLDRKVK